MSSDSKVIKGKDKTKSKAQRKKNLQENKKSEIKKVHKISEKYLKEELQVENSLKERIQTHPLDDDFAKKKQSEIDFFCDPFSTIPLNIEKTSDENENESERADDMEEVDSHKSEAPRSSHSNESSPNTHMASTYIGQDHESVVGKFELTRITYDEAKLLFYPKSLKFLHAPLNDEEKNIKVEDDGLFIRDPPLLEKNSNKFLLLDRLHESNSTELIDSNGDLRNFESLVDENVYRLSCDRKFKAIYVPPMPMHFEPLEKIINEKKFLKILISTLNFDQHKMFTNEHYAAKMVEKLFDEYDRRTKFDIVETLKNKLSNLRELKAERFPHKLSKTPPKNEEILLNQQIKNVRTKLHAEEHYDQKILTSLLENWKNLKTIRNQQNFAATNLTLKIQKLETDLSEKQAERQRQYDAELNEMIAEEFDKYYAAKQKYKEMLKNSNDPDQIIHEEQTIRKPKKPDIDKIVTELNEIYDKLPTNDVDLNIVLSHDENQFKTKDRTRKFNRLSYRIELEVDGEIVGSTKLCRLDENFRIPVQSAFILKLTKHLPEKLKLIIFEIKATTKKLTEILLPIPDDDETYSEETEIQHFTFSSKQVQRKNSNARFSSFRRSSKSKLINTSGSISIKIGWTNSEEANIDDLNETKVIKKSIRNLSQNEIISHGVLQKWFDQKLLNPLDPDTKNLAQFIIDGDEIGKLNESKSTTTAKESELFRFNEDELAFCTKEEFDSIERFHLLKARYNNDLSYKNKKLIPQLERELELERDKDANIIDESLIADPIDLQRFRGRKYLRKVYEIITNHCENLNRDKMNTNILIGDEFPTFSSLSLAFFEMFGPKRPLKPTRRITSSRTSCKINEVTNFNIVVTVVRATNVPIRCNETQVSSRKSSTLSTPGTGKFTPFKHSNIHPHVFVAISLKDHHHTCRTSSAEGTNPMWNEQLTLPFNINSDDSKRCLSIDLYDEVIEDLIDNVAEVYQRITSKWLGTLKIPVINICTNQRIEGTFELNIPSVLVGYTKPKFSPADQQTSIAIENLPDLSKKTYISLFISLEPSVEIPQLISSGLECIEVVHVEQHIKIWFEQLKLEFPSRTQKWNPLVTLLSGKRCCITRLLSPLTVPFEKNETTEQLIRRFVSLIPIQYDANTTHSSCTGLNGVWLSNNHVLGLMTSSTKDLGVLLTCYYLELGIPAWLILGSSTTCGESCFVLIRETNEFFIIDPSSARKYSSKDIYCPLTKCYCLVNQYNVWANIQREQRVFLTQFDVNRSFDWRPMFQKVIDIPNGTIHDSSFKYERSFDTRDLQRTIQAKIIKKINSWRSHRKTVWNRFVCENLRAILLRLEDDICFENDNEDHAEMLKMLFVNHKVIGYTINCKYTNLSSIVTEIKNTGIHLNLDNKVEFAVNVYVKEYANNVLSIWIFLMSLIPKV
ncbi:hypothetical protein PVAND_006814 [Polypedilum vanderplanki]|uniref:C2 domain-containing protein n=1 Tax=Polypedilum vanderplanki TaxID=319348 RepID=A0A9J6C5C1_POLVA|nr:hypothetical protein PVAND_006814 [Polypedilum vanderplanki]